MNIIKAIQAETPGSDQDEPITDWKYSSTF
jgi:hypothetical protein